MRYKGVTKKIKTMRIALFLSAILFLFQSCYTYKSFDNSPDRMIVGKTYKIQRNGSKKFEKITIKGFSDSSAVVTQRFEAKKIPLSEISKVKSRKFSVVKTVLYPVAAVTAIAGLFALTYNGPQVSGSFTMPD